MSEGTEFIKNYWEYYKQLEEQFISTKKYVAFSSYNKSTYSLEYLELLQAACSEIDVIAKVICKKLDSNFKTKEANMKTWYYGLQDKLDLENTVINCDAFDSEYNEIKPWDKCHYEISSTTDENGRIHKNYKLGKRNSTPKWWTAYNKAKHGRTEIVDEKPNFTRANLENVLYAFAALYSLEKKYIKLLNDSAEIGEQISELFFIGRRPFTLLAQ